MEQTIEPHPVKLNWQKHRCHFQAFDLDTCYADAVGFPDPVECADAVALPSFASLED
jgi:hypothetical protein